MTLERFFIKPWVLRDTDRPRKKFYTWAKSRPISDGTIRKIRMHSNLKASVTNVLSVAFVTAAAKTLSPERLVDEMLISELVAYLPYKDSKPQNRFAYFTFPIPTVGGDDVYKKLRNCKRESFKSMVGPDVLGTYFFFKLVSTICMEFRIYVKFCLNKYLGRTIPCVLVPIVADTCDEFRPLE